MNLPLYFATWAAGLTGLVLGSFATVLIWRLYHDHPEFIWGRSHCTHCKKKLRWNHLVPLFSWLYQKGACAFCEKEISIVYPMTEVVFAGVFILFTRQFLPDAFTWEALTHFGLLMVIVFLAVVLWLYDLWFFTVDRWISFPAIGLALIWAVSREEPFTTFAIGGGIGFLFYFLQHRLSDGKWVGEGDQELGLFMGLMLGWKWFLLALFLAYLFGLIVSLPLLLLGKAHRHTALPMGAFLMPALLIMLYAGDQMWEVYWEWLSF